MQSGNLFQLTDTSRPSILVTMSINPENTNVDYSRRSVFLLGPVQPVFKNKTYPKSLRTDICWDLNFTNHQNFPSLEIVYHGSETQLQVLKLKLNRSVL